MLGKTDDLIDDIYRVPPAGMRGGDFQDLLEGKLSFAGHPEIELALLEEVFFRSFFYRALASRDFEKVALSQFFWMPFLVTSLAFGLQHREWLAGVLCGFAFQGLVLWKKRLGDAITAHALTNLLLGLWVVGKGAVQFW